jgi:hypothetical protein
VPPGSSGSPISPSGTTRLYSTSGGQLGPKGSQNETPCTLKRTRTLKTCSGSATTSGSVQFLMPAASLSIPC